MEKQLSLDWDIQSLNSTMVRLKLIAGEFYGNGLFNWSQFHYGSIKTWLK